MKGGPSASVVWHMAMMFIQKCFLDPLRVKRNFLNTRWSEKNTFFSSSSSFFFLNTHVYQLLYLYFTACKSEIVEELRRVLEGSEKRKIENNCVSSFIFFNKLPGKKRWTDGAWWLLISIACFLFVQQFHICGKKKEEKKIKREEIFSLIKRGLGL